MKNTRSYKLTAILLAVIMMIGILPATAGADGFNPLSNSTYKYNATESAVITFASDGRTVNGVADLDPNKVSTMVVNVKDTTGKSFPKDNKGQIIVAVPQNVVVTAEDAAACSSNEVTCSYGIVNNQLVFKFKDNATDEFTAILPVRPNMPAVREDVSGTYVLVIKNKNKQLRTVNPTIVVIDGVNRLKATETTLFNGEVISNGSDIPTWKIQRYTGDWYSISIGGQYLVFGQDGNNISFSSTPYYYRYAKDGAGNQFIAYDSNGTKYFLNNKSNDVNKGIQGSTYNDQCVELYSKSTISSDQGMIVFNTNGGSVATSFDPIIAETGTAITLPNYTGTKKGTQFIGWAKYSNIYVYHDGNKSSYCEVYLPGTEYTVTAGNTVLYAVFNENNSGEVQFGFRADGTIPKEPEDYQVKEYTGHIHEIQNAVIVGRWVVDVDGNKPIEGNHIANNVTANLSVLPTDEQIKKTMPDYDPETMYVHWYVLKYSGKWKVDGVIRNRTSYSVGYDMNMKDENRNYIQNMPKGFEFGELSTITVGAEKDGTVKTPSLEGFEFTGWNTAANGEGVSYESGQTIEATGSVTLYAQWKEIPKYVASFSLTKGNENMDHPDPVTSKQDEEIEIPAAEDIPGYIFSGWMINGEKITEKSIKMPEGDVEITGVYYGPIEVEIRSNWPEGKMGYLGAKITLTAETIGPDNLDYYLQWQYLDNGDWVDVPGATEYTYTYELSEETSGRSWRVAVRDVRPHQD